MQLHIVVDCTPSFTKKAEYTLATYFDVLGLSYRFCKRSDIPADATGVWYGTAPPEFHGRLLFIQANKDAENFFSERKSFDATRARKFRYGEDECVALFYTEAFRRDSTVVSTGDNRARHLLVDIVASGFYFLSCWQEYTSTEHDRHERFPASASIQSRLGILHTPVVNQYIEILRVELEKVLGRSAHPTPRFAGREFAITISHDVDYIRKWTLGIAYRELVQYFLLGRLERTVSKRSARLRAFLGALSKRGDPVRSSIEKILKLEEAHQIHGTYFLKAGATSRHDVSYRLNDGYAHKLIKRLETSGHEVGLHPSYHTYLDVARMKVEKGRLEGAVGQRVNGVRQHFLRFRVPDTWRAHAGLGFQYDSTLGFADHEGFRAGICHPFRPYDVHRDEPLNVWEVPLTAMDATFQSYTKKSPREALELLRQLTLTISKYRGVAVLLFHHTCFDELDYPGWGGVFEEFLGFAIDQGAFIGTTKEVLDSFLRSLPPSSH